MHPADAILTAFRRGDWRLAQTLAVQALARPDVDRAHLHALLGKIAWQLQDRPVALTYLEAAVDRGVDDPTVWTLLAQLQDHRPERRLQLLARAAAHPRGGGPQALTYAQALMDAGRNEDALTWLARAADDPQSAAAALALIAELGLVQSDLELVADALTQFSALDPPVDVALVAQLLPQIVAQLRDCLAVDDLVDRAQTAGASAQTIAKWRALRQVSLRNPHAAVQFAQAAVALLPTDADAQRILGECLLLHGDVELAQHSLSVAAQLAPLPVMTALAVADGLRTRGDAVAAVAVVEAVVAHTADHAGAWLELSRLYADLGRDDEAQQAVLRAMALDGRVDEQAGRSTRFLRAALDGLPQVLAGLGRAGPWQVARLRMGHNALLVQLQLPAGDELFAKVTLPGRRSQAHIEQTALLEHQLAGGCQAHFAVPDALTDARGQRAQPLADGWVTVTPAISGVSLRRSLAQPRTTMTPQHAAHLGTALAHLHAGMAQLPNWQRSPQGLTSALGPLLELDRDPTAWRRLRTQLGLYGTGLGLGDALERHLTALLPRLTVLAQRLPTGIVHGDFGWHNATWRTDPSQRPQVVGIVDLDYAARDWPLVDLAQAIARTAADWKRLATHRDPAARPQLAQALVSGYELVAGRLQVDRRQLLDVVAATRFSYGLALATAAIEQRDPRTPQAYGPALDGLDLLQLQLQWLDQDGAALLG
ncbi:MAG: tetratricopeptide repeat protein [Myxococcales bacterium]|nr:tetratricopeptide repeat protein [Myxococcales bacterium]